MPIISRIIMSCHVTIRSRLRHCFETGSFVTIKSREHPPLILSSPASAVFGAASAALPSLFYDFITNLLSLNYSLRFVGNEIVFYCGRLKFGNVYLPV